MTKYCKCGHKKTDHKYNNSTWRCWGADFANPELDNLPNRRNLITDFENLWDFLPTCKCKIWRQKQ